MVSPVIVCIDFVREPSRSLHRELPVGQSDATVPWFLTPEVCAQNRLVYARFFCGAYDDTAVTEPDGFLGFFRDFSGRVAAV